MENTKKAEKLANDILDFVNVFGFDAEKFAETICGVSVNELNKDKHFEAVVG